ncbi:hypothetical protein V5F44_20615 [Xanthobacter sp. V2C-8]|uniref:hypothetical protein n=1 Tax=Xanthobacter albus TaxID=3119929 RepID=UPI00372B868C
MTTTKRKRMSKMVHRASDRADSKDWMEAYLERAERERKEFIAELEREMGRPIPEDLADFLI